MLLAVVIMVQGIAIVIGCNTTKQEESIRLITQNIIDEYLGTEGPLLPILHAIQKEFRYIPNVSIPVIASNLIRTEADIYGVISFYHYFRTTPPGRTIIQICRAEACQAMGGQQIERDVKQALGINFHGTTDDGLFSLEPVFCLGNCACAPNVQINENIHGYTNSEEVVGIIEKLRVSYNEN